MDPNIRKLKPSEIAHREHVKYHKQCVEKFCSILAERIVERGIHHDDSKLEDPEYTIFSEHEFDKKREYGSEQYYKNLETNLKQAIDHHYEANRHHPEHFEEGISGMNLVDLVEMVSDWIAAAGYHKSKFEDIVKHNAFRFGMSKQLQHIILNTYEEIKHIKDCGEKKD